MIIEITGLFMICGGTCIYLFQFIFVKMQVFNERGSPSTIQLKINLGQSPNLNSHSFFLNKNV